MAGRLEWWVACGMTAFLLVCHVIRLQSAGGLYRDEANSVYLATQVPNDECFEKMEFDSCPYAWLLLLRAWHAVGLAPSDMGWRALAFIIGLFLVGLTWVASSRFGGGHTRRTPVVALFLIGFCPTTLMVGDSVRAYGFGMCCTIASIVLTWRAIQKPCAARWGIATVMYCVSVHVAFHAAMVVFALGVAAACVGASRRSAGQALTPLVAGAIAGATLAVYTPVFERIGEWSYLLKQPLSLGILLGRWVEALHVVGRIEHGEGSSMTLLQKWVAATIWIGFLATGITLTWRSLPRLFWDRFRNRSQGRDGEACSEADDGELVLFITAGLLAFVPAYLAVLYIRGWMPAAKYYLIAIAFTAIMIDCALRVGNARAARARAITAVVTALLAIVTSHSVFEGAFTRWTNIDLAASVINERAKEGDLVIVQPWELGVSFSRYCRRGVTWMTLPPLADNTLHRYDLYRKVILDPSAGIEICRAVRRMSVNGGDVWYVGSELFVSSDSKTLSGSPMSLHGVSCLEGQFRECEQLPPLTTQRVAPHENVSIIHLRR